MRLGLTLAVGAVLSVLVFGPARANQTATTVPDGSVSFEVSTSSVTRISVVGDRIRKIVNDETAFEMSNDSDTGDVFLRSVDGGVGETETGFIVTEKGVTIGYTLKPVAKKVASVLITVNGDAPGASGSAVSGSLTGGDLGGGLGYGNSITSHLTAVVREVALAHVVGRKRPKGGDGHVLSTVKGDGWKASVRVASGGKLGRLVREQDFYKKGVLAVWVERNQLGPGEVSFVIVVEAK